jgi:hypothetical protein
MSTTLLLLPAQLLAPSLVDIGGFFFRCSCFLLLLLLLSSSSMLLLLVVVVVVSLLVVVLLAVLVVAAAAVVVAATLLRLRPPVRRASPWLRGRSCRGSWTAACAAHVPGVLPRAPWHSWLHLVILCVVVFRCRHCRRCCLVLSLLLLALFVVLQRSRLCVWVSVCQMILMSVINCGAAVVCVWCVVCVWLTFSCCVCVWLLLLLLLWWWRSSSSLPLPVMVMARVLLPLLHSPTLTQRVLFLRPLCVVVLWGVRRVVRVFVCFVFL